MQRQVSFFIECVWGAADDGFLDAHDLQQSFGNTADVKQMIAAADKNGDGKVDEPSLCFCKF